MHGANITPDLMRTPVDSGLAGLRAYAGEVLLWTGAEHAVAAARGAADAASVVAGWCLAEGRLAAAVEAVELGRGLLLHAVTAATTVSGMLRADGYDDLAAEWDRTPERTAPGDVRRRVVDALGADGRMNRLTSTPSIAAIAAALRTIGADVLVYLLPADVDRPGRLLVVDSTGTVCRVPAPELRLDPDGPVAGFAGTGPATRWVGALDAVCDWAWPAAIAPLLDHLNQADPVAPGRAHRVVLVPIGATGCVPWHAARVPSPSGHRYACHDLVVSYATSAAQLLDVAARDQLPVGKDAVFVANPLGDQDGAVFEALALRMIFYAGSTAYGRPGARGDGPGTPDEVLTHLPGRDTPGASLLHLSCHAHAGANPAESHLRLVDTASGAPAALPVGRILRQARGRPEDTPGGIVVLSACSDDLTIRDYDEALTLATAFIAAGAVGVVATRWAVSDRMTPPLMFMFHHFLTGAGMSPADALRATQVWSLDPRREYPSTLPDVFRGDFASHDFTATAAWAAFGYQGR
jgi:hypothetical protein